MFEYALTSTLKRHTFGVGFSSEAPFGSVHTERHQTIDVREENKARNSFFGGCMKDAQPRPTARPGAAVQRFERPESPRQDS